MPFWEELAPHDPGYKPLHEVVSLYGTAGELAALMSFAPTEVLEQAFHKWEHVRDTLRVTRDRFWRENDEISSTISALDREFRRLLARVPYERQGVAEYEVCRFCGSQLVHFRVGPIPWNTTGALDGVNLRGLPREIFFCTNCLGEIDDLRAELMSPRCFHIDV
jgi:hypothetical protein